MAIGNKFQDAVDSLNSLTAALRGVHDEMREQSAHSRSLETRLREAENRAEIAERLSSENAAKAARTDELEKYATQLVESLDRLPVRMEDAGLVETPVPPEIPLYATWEWSNVANAKQLLARVLKPKQ